MLLITATTNAVSTATPATPPATPPMTAARRRRCVGGSRRPDDWDSERSPEDSTFTVTEDDQRDARYARGKSRHYATGRRCSCLRIRRRRDQDKGGGGRHEPGYSGHLVKVSRTVCYSPSDVEGAEAAADDVDHGAVLLQASLHEDECRVLHDLGVRVDEPLRDDDVDEPVFVLEQEKDRPAGGLGTLAHRHEPADGDRAPVLEPLEVTTVDRTAALQPLAHELHWMALETEPHRVVVDQDPPLA